jgi:hypothetical protein
MALILRLAVKLVIVQKDGSLIKKFILLIITKPNYRLTGSILLLTAVNAIRLWFLKKQKVNVSPVTKMCIKQQWVWSVSAATLRNRGW